MVTRLLVLEDQPFQRMAAVSILNRLADCSVFEADDGATAINIINQQGAPLDIVFCDLQMEGMNGFEFIRHIAEDGLALAVVLACTQEDDIVKSLANMTRAYGLELLGVLTKPFMIEDVETILAHYRLSKQQKDKFHDARFDQVEQLSVDCITKALEAQQFEPYFQPKVSSNTGDLMGVEALARMPMVNGELVYPEEFIPAVENNGLVDHLTHIILEKSIQYGKIWLTKIKPLPIAVNLSPISLSDVSLTDHVCYLLDKYEFPHELLILEVTESAIVKNMAYALESLSRLRMKGIHLSIDDFGTGYSSLLQLTEMPFTELKIDQSLVAGIDRNQKHYSTVSSMIEMAMRLNLTVVAEGVETKAEWDILTEMGCDLLQGFYILKPLPGDQLFDWVD